MGSRFEITAVARTQDHAEAAVEAAYAEIDRIEGLISSWRESSETSAINRSAGGPAVEVSRELFDLIRRGMRVSELTGGAFDLTFAGTGKLWDFKDPTQGVPNENELLASLELVDYRLVDLNAGRSSVRLPKTGMKIGLGAIGKGYAANRAAKVLEELDVVGGLVNAGGDLVAFGQRDNGTSWTVGIADPLNPERVFAHVELADRAIVTSGDYEQYFEIDGVRYAHILDPRTGWPVRGVTSATVLCADAELADALATSIFVLGVEDGLELINQLRGVEALIVDDHLQIHFSTQLRGQIQEEHHDENRN